MSELAAPALTVHHRPPKIDHRRKEFRRIKEHRKIRWGKKLDFVETAKNIVALMAKYRTECQAPPDEFDWKSPFAPTMLALASTLLIQLQNLCRAQEALDGLRLWVGYAPKRNFVNQVRVRKYRPVCAHCHHVKTGVKSGHEVVGVGARGRCLVKDCPCQHYDPDPADVEMRDIDIPADLPESDVPYLQEAFKRGKLSPSRYINFSREKLGTNTHSLRFSSITYLGKLGYTSSQIRTITHHASTKEIEGYMEESAGDEARAQLRNMKFS
ncbi:MAG: hypothetical protein OK422_04425 [Thaumarchaeota archaeon]|nr:hypothetical protein [Nitrososphaerota archaeon]